MLFIDIGLLKYTSLQNCTCIMQTGEEMSKALIYSENLRNQLWSHSWVTVLVSLGNFNTSKQQKKETMRMLANLKIYVKVMVDFFAVINQNHTENAVKMLIQRV